MSRWPRILPLVGVAIGGVLVVNALSGAQGITGLVSATRAAAEEALTPKARGKHAKAKVPAPTAEAPAIIDPAAAMTSPVAPGAGVAPVAPVCAPSAAELARQAGLSPAELQVLQSLGTRRGEIDQREKDLDTQVQLLTAAEQKLDAKLKGMNSLKDQIQALLGQADEKTEGEVTRLVDVYSKMKAADAARVMATLDEKVRTPVAAKMKPAILAAILGKMDSLDAKKLTEALAHRFAPVQALAAAATAPPAPMPAPAAAAPLPGSADPTAPPEPVKAKPKPAKKAAAKPKAKPAASAKADAPKLDPGKADTAAPKVPSVAEAKPASASKPAATTPPPPAATGKGG